MEHYVASKEWAEKLKKAGWKRPTEFYWVEYLDDPGSFIRKRELCVNILSSMELCGDIIIKNKYPAPLTDELLEVLPFQLDCYRAEWIDDIYRLRITKDAVYKQISYASKSKNLIVPLSEDKSLPNALAAMLCYLAEQGIVKLW
jgi:hypothetical protein